MTGHRKRPPYTLSNINTSRLGKLKLRVKASIDGAQTSLFFWPMVAVLIAIIGGILLTRLDEFLTEHERNMPTVLSTTVASARVMLATVAGATISFAGTAFSVSLLVIQLASSQYSPRVTSTLFRDPFNKRVMALVVGTFTYCLVVLRSVQEQEDGDADLVPHISVALASVLGIISILAIVGFIDHAAHSMDISDLLERVSMEAIQQVQTLWTIDEPESDTCDDKSAHHNSNSNSDINSNSHVVRFRSTGWVQEINWQALEWLVEEEGCIQLQTAPGRYAILGVPICSISPCPTEEDDCEELDNRVHDAISIGRNRTNRDDAGYGLRQIVDVSLRALSPGINDPTTAQDAIFHAAAVVLEFLRRRPPSSVRVTPSGGRLVLGEEHTYNSIVLLAYDEVRRCAASSPTVCVYLLESLRQIRESLKAQGLEDRAPEIERQAHLIEQGCLLSQQVDADHQFIRQARIDRFPDSYAEVVKSQKSHEK